MVSRETDVTAQETLISSYGERETQPQKQELRGRVKANSGPARENHPKKAKEGKPEACKKLKQNKKPFSCVICGKNETEIGLNHEKHSLMLTDKREKAELFNCRFVSTFSRNGLSSNKNKKRKNTQERSEIVKSGMIEERLSKDFT